MKKTVVQKIIQARVEHLEMKMTGMKKNPEYYKYVKEVAMWKFSLTLLEQVQETSVDVDSKWLVNTCTTTAVGYTPIEVKAGDSILELMEKNKDVKNLSEKLNKACAKQGLTMNWSEGIIE